MKLKKRKMKVDLDLLAINQSKFIVKCTGISYVRIAFKKSPNQVCGSDKKIWYSVRKENE